MEPTGTTFTSVCGCCKQTKTVDNFHKSKRRANGYERLCKPCRKEYLAELYVRKWFDKTCTGKKSWCKVRGIPFDLTPEYLEQIWTDCCPISGKPFVRGDKTSPDSPALDREIPEFGYVQGNVSYISARMNRIKMDATVAELEAIIAWLKG